MLVLPAFGLLSHVLVSSSGVEMQRYYGIVWAIMSIR